ncbi:MAG: hypothetical protein VYE35_02520 [Chloroflexota bacterium]|mgnify:FL=1|nr:hypothetical protein [Dehalococcoidia bacterium]MEC8856161.1 hypothetical protein [Chloroflexota bacterium]MEC8958575.1 hypothetical protein [Chloroflexota bacterium]MEC9287439.1 hypothetical protein [Chloroflexota bacterium]MEE3249761.1 hypothetical protein [Chloroflexota bacterium]
MTSFSIDRATYSVGESALDVMVLEKSAFPESFQGHQIIREGTLDNDTLAQNGFEGTTSKRFSEAGRVTGVMRELGPTSNMAMVDGFDFMAASVVHLFDSPDSVHSWMHEIFLKDFEDRVGESVGQGHQLVSATRLEPQGFFDETVGLRVLQGGVDGLISSTVIDFRVGRLLGVVFIGAVGDHDRLEQVEKLGQDLEKRIVSVVLGSA